MLKRGKRKRSPVGEKSKTMEVVSGLEDRGGVGLGLGGGG